MYTNHSFVSRVESAERLLETFKLYTYQIKILLDKTEVLFLCVKERHHASIFNAK